jgi:hypothetical protein
MLSARPSTTSSRVKLPPADERVAALPYALKVEVYALQEAKAKATELREELKLADRDIRRRLRVLNASGLPTTLLADITGSDQAVVYRAIKNAPPEPSAS